MPVPDDASTEASVYDVVQQNPFQPLQPEDVQPTPSSPAPENRPEVDGGTSGEDVAAAQHEQAQAEQPEKPKREFDARYREPFRGLMYLGYLEKTFTLWGHTFVVKTLTTEEHAEIGLYVRDYEGTRSSNAVYQSAVVAAAVKSLDGEPLPLPLGPSDSGLTAKIVFVMKNWMPPVREKIWDEIFALEVEVREVLDEMGNASG